jgi:hypothetical protein
MTLRIEPRGRGIAAVAIIAGALVAAAPVVAMLHLDHLPLRLCAFKAFTGLPCASCGATRALARLARLDVAGAVHVNPLAVVSYVGLVLAGLVDLVLFLRGRRLRLDTAQGEWRFILAVGALAVILNWLYMIHVGT